MCLVVPAVCSYCKGVLQLVAVLSPLQKLSLGQVWWYKEMSNFVKVSRCQPSLAYWMLSEGTSQKFRQAGRSKISARDAEAVAHSLLACPCTGWLLRLRHAEVCPGSMLCQVCCTLQNALSEVRIDVELDVSGEVTSAVFLSHMSDITLHDIACPVQS